MQPGTENIGCAVIVQNERGEVLLGKRKNSFKAGQYGMPGGRIEGKETTDAAAARELLEETGITATTLDYVGVIKHWQGDKNFVHFIYLCTSWTGEITCAEPDKCEGWKWYNVEDLPASILAGHKEAVALLTSEKTLSNLE